MKRLILLFMLLVITVFSYGEAKWETLNTNPTFVRDGIDYTQYTETLASGDKQNMVVIRQGEDYYDVKFALMPPATFDTANCWWSHIFKITLGDTEVPKELISLNRFPDNYRVIYMWIYGDEAKQSFIDLMISGAPLTIYLKDGDVKTIFTIDNTNFKEQFDKVHIEYRAFKDASAEKARLEEEAKLNPVEEQW